MLKDEFSQLMKLFHEASDTKVVNLEEVFAKSLEFFEHLREQIAKGSPEDKKEALQMMSEMYSQLILESKHISDVAGMTEEQLVSFAENPANFTPEQWKSIQMSKERIADAGSDLAKAIESLHKTDLPPSGEKKPPKDKKTKRSEWMKS
jgi:hypothetical protein